MTYYAPPEGDYEDSHAYTLMSGVLKLRLSPSNWRALVPIQTRGLLGKGSLIVGSSGGHTRQRNECIRVGTLTYRRHELMLSKR
jgi:hypothetical protein